MKARHITERLQWRPSAAEQPSSIMLLLAGDVAVPPDQNTFPGRQLACLSCCDMIMGLNTHMNFDF